jgi:hypothetical protein
MTTGEIAEALCDYRARLLRSQRIVQGYRHQECGDVSGEVTKTLAAIGRMLDITTKAVSLIEQRPNMPPSRLRPILLAVRAMVEMLEAGETAIEPEDCK